jgi:hypothetical protein
VTDKLHTYVFQGTRRDSGPGPTFSEFEIEIKAHTAADALTMFKANTKAEAEQDFPRRYYKLRHMAVKKERNG